MNCRNCNHKISHEFIDLYTSPPSNSFLTETELLSEEVYYPLKVMVCEECFLVQIGEFKKTNEIFSHDYVYFSSYSTSWLEHASKYTDSVTERFALNEKSFVVEVASNDGYLLRNFVTKNIPCLGVEPTSGTAKVAQSIGVNTMVEFFGVKTAKLVVEKHGKADLALGNNVLAHVPDLHDFLGGFKELLKDDGVATFEFPHLLKLIENNQFDTIYHEHYSYFSLLTVIDILARSKLRIFDVEQVVTHGGSLRVYVCHELSSHLAVSRVQELLDVEKSCGMDKIGFYENFSIKVDKVKYDFMAFLLDAKKQNKKVIGYGAAAKGNTLLNFCGVKEDLISHVVDASPYKQGKFLPGSRIPVVSKEIVRILKPDYIIIFPWNIMDEVINQNKELFGDARVVVTIPEFRIYE
jgi:SAM-dependent methyltransferase